MKRKPNGEERKLYSWLRGLFSTPKPLCVISREVLGDGHRAGHDVAMLSRFQRTYGSIRDSHRNALLGVIQPRRLKEFL